MGTLQAALRLDRPSVCEAHSVHPPVQQGAAGPSFISARPTKRCRAQRQLARAAEQEQTLTAFQIDAPGVGSECFFLSSPSPIRGLQD